MHARPHTRVALALAVCRPVDFGVDAADLNDTFKQLQWQLHPDKFVRRGWGRAGAACRKPLSAENHLSHPRNRVCCTPCSRQDLDHR